jgi:hypothetical protein
MASGKFKPIETRLLINGEVSFDETKHPFPDGFMLRHTLAAG